MSRRKDQERFLRLKQQNPDYVGFRGFSTANVRAQVALESVTCSVCNRKRNVPSDSLPEDRDSYICARCQESEAAAPAN